MEIIIIGLLIVFITVGIYFIRKKNKKKGIIQEEKKAPSDDIYPLY